MFSGIDILIGLLVLISVVIGGLRGFLKEFVSVATWGAAIAITLLYTSRFSSLLPKDSIESPQARYAISAVLLFVLTMIIGGMINFLVQKAMQASRKGRQNFLWGLFFGFVRGWGIVVLLVLMANLVPTFKQENWWRQSLFLPNLQDVAGVIHRRLPNELAQHFDFTSASL